MYGLRTLGLGGIMMLMTLLPFHAFVVVDVAVNTTLLYAPRCMTYPGYDISQFISSHLPSQLDPGVETKSRTTDKQVAL